MTRNASAEKKPAPPPPPANRNPITASEAWYLECYVFLSGHLGRSPSMPEFATWLQRAVNPCYCALRSLEAKGYLRREMLPGTSYKRFQLVEKKAAK